MEQPCKGHSKLCTNSLRYGSPMSCQPNMTATSGLFVCVFAKLCLFSSIYNIQGWDGARDDTEACGLCCLNRVNLKPHGHIQHSLKFQRFAEEMGIIKTINLNFDFLHMLSFTIWAVGVRVQRWAQWSNLHEHGNRCCTWHWV